MISDKQTKHIVEVARLMKSLAKKLNLDEKEMFLLGYLHDIGYEFSDHRDHSFVGGELLKLSGYKYYREVYYHGVPDADYKSTELDLLNYCDMHINKEGNYVTFAQRLEDIKSRRGKNSEAYINSEIIISNLITKKFLED